MHPLVNYRQSIKHDPERSIRALSALACLFAATIVSADGVSEKIQAGTRLLENPHFDILVALVAEMSDEGATNANPPRGKLVIEEILRGRERLGPVLAQLSAPVRQQDYERPQEGKLKPEWFVRSFHGPKIGDRVIVFGNLDASGALIVQPEAVYRFSKENRDAVLRYMAPAERSAWIQAPIALLLLALPLIGLVFLLAQPISFVSDRMRRRLRRCNYVFPLIAAVLYAFYESGISIYTNIRVDLLLIWPALGLTGILALLTLIVDVRAVFRRRRNESWRGGETHD